MTLITDHVTQALARMVPSMSGLPNWELLVTALVNRYQGIENVFDDLLVMRRLANAEGVQLEQLGKIVGEDRKSRTDDEYRRAIGARVAANNSDGTIPDIIKVCRGVLDETQSIVIRQYYPKAVTVRISTDELSIADATTLAELLDDTRSGETRLIVEHHTLPAADTYTLGSITDLSAIHAIGATLLKVDSTVGFDESGDLVIDKYGATEEAVTYTSKTATQFIGVSATVNGHTSGTVRQGDSSDKGLSSTSDLTSGGGFASAIG